MVLTRVCCNIILNKVTQNYMKIDATELWRLVAKRYFSECNVLCHVLGGTTFPFTGIEEKWLLLGLLCLYYKSKISERLLCEESVSREIGRNRNKVTEWFRGNQSWAVGGNKPCVRPRRQTCATILSGNIHCALQLSQNDWKLFISKGFMPKLRRPVLRTGHDTLREVIEFKCSPSNGQQMSSGTCKPNLADGKKLISRLGDRRSYVVRYGLNTLTISRRHQPQNW